MFEWIVILLICLAVIIVEYTKKPQQISIQQKNREYLDYKDKEWKDLLEKDFVESEHAVYIKPGMESISAKRTSVDDVQVENTIESKTVLADQVDFVSGESKVVRSMKSSGDVRTDRLIQSKGTNECHLAFVTKQVDTKFCVADEPVSVPNVDIFKKASTMRVGKTDHIIPRIIHMNWGLWDDGPLPDNYQELLAEWKRQLPNHKFMIWNRKKSELFIREEFPIWYPLWRACTRKVMLSDLLRTLVVYRYGGMYRDLDLKNLGCQDIWTKQGCLLFTETVLEAQFAEQVGREQRIRAGHPEELIRVANYAFASAPYEPFLYFVLHEMRQRWDLSKDFHDDYDILYITGPALWSTVRDRHKTAAHLYSLKESQSMIKHLALGGWRKGEDAL